MIYYIYRFELEPLSCTDLKQKWGKGKGKKVEHEYAKPIPVLEFCHVKRASSHVSISKSTKEKNFNLFISSNFITYFIFT